MNFQNKTIFVTGAASGIGKATALEFSARGAKVAVVDRNSELLAEVVDQIEETGAEALALHCDLTQGDEVFAAVQATVSRWGGLDCAVNAAGVEGATKKLLDEDDALFDLTMDVNLRAVWYCMRSQIEQMLKQAEGGSIVNVSSGAGLVGSARSAVYSASKHAVLGLTRSAGLQYARNGVRINAVCPSGVQTPMADRIVDSFEGGAPSKGGAGYPLGRYSTPEEIASGIMWLSSAGAASAIGSVLTIDAGFTAG
ncbi:SDR family oxidoreductase [Rhodococcus sp. ARC_M6]|uniref:SDR family oxidoreductase n=1 Tax=Rhodococcus sp. ARC_M6 TaxID=2928852 RepID=UPI001FB46EE1|nr:SDR family oxidoreductase [Rhodococcus sp. ARC_M6]